ncbi:hypothetical protein EMCG_03135 [[Emmonsia] crescens]|uniref:Uncharacterized protein n=1 Tax=[Emmonsia] crescens TaxID=73230 RepID=A0A0G2HW68_9EURO|nr:hypothetical protein EMCG_03135 [Emmonsia crescens UAMH 3008]
MHISLAVVSLGLLGLSRAQKSIVTELSFPGPLDTQPPVVASVVNADPTATVYELRCVEGTDETECGLNHAILTQAPNMIGMSFESRDEDGPSSFHLECKIQGASADCTMIHQISQTGKGWSTVSSEAAQIPTAGFVTPLKVTITAGLEKLQGPSATPAPSSGVAPTGTGTNPPTTNTSSGLATMPLITAAANWGAIGGAAVAVAALVM